VKIPCARKVKPVERMLKIHAHSEILIAEFRKNPINPTRLPSEKFFSLYADAQHMLADCGAMAVNEILPGAAPQGEEDG
jgi:hypothetical protein